MYKCVNYEYMFVKKYGDGVRVFYLKCYIWDSDKNKLRFDLRKKIKKRDFMY